MRTTRRWRAVAGLATVALLVGSACTKDDDEGASSGDPADSGDVGQQIEDLAADCPEGFDTAGIDGNVIKLVSSYPQEGALAAFAEIAEGYNAYFDMVNEAGGVEVAGEKYTIEVEGFNDNYVPSETVEQVGNALGEDGTGAFGTFSVVGTANNIAIRESLEANCVPNIFASTGSPSMGNPEYPWTIGSSLPLYSTEAAAFAEYLKTEKPDATVAMLLQEGEYGDGYELSFQQAIEGTDITVVATERYEAGLSTDVTSQVTKLADTGADVFFNGATLLPCPQGLSKAAELGWETITYVSGTCASKTLTGAAGPAAEGILSAPNLMDPNDPQWDDDPRMQEYKETVQAWKEKTGSDGSDPLNGIVGYGWTLADIFVTALENSEAMTRSAVLTSLNNLDLTEPGVTFPGITIKTGEGDRFLGEAAFISQYSLETTAFSPVGEISDFEGGDSIPPELITAE